MKLGRSIGTRQQKPSSLRCTSKRLIIQESEARCHACTAICKIAVSESKLTAIALTKGNKESWNGKERESRCFVTTFSGSRIILTNEKHSTSFNSACGRKSLSWLRPIFSKEERIKEPWDRERWGFAASSNPSEWESHLPMIQLYIEQSTFRLTPTYFLQNRRSSTG